ncbi:MAG: hypothetical protein L0K86_24715 [Actinomycetia bacterium]|nr:hypothetical protein [Actinomycetes bacterium]
MDTDDRATTTRPGPSGGDRASGPDPGMGDPSESGLLEQIASAIRSAHDAGVPF